MSQAYLDEATKWIGTKEVPGSGDNPAIVTFHSYTTLHSEHDSVPWCSSFVNFIVTTVGGKLPATKSAAARSWLDWGKTISTPVPGCIVVIDRKDANNPNAAHVGFYAGTGTNPQNIRVLGGNQGDKVCIAEFSRSKVIGFRDAA